MNKIHQFELYENTDFNQEEIGTRQCLISKLQAQQRIPSGDSKKYEINKKKLKTKEL